MGGFLFFEWMWPFHMNFLYTDVSVNIYILCMSEYTYVRVLYIDYKNPFQSPSGFFVEPFHFYRVISQKMWLHSSVFIYRYFLNYWYYFWSMYQDKPKLQRFSNFHVVNFINNFEEFSCWSFYLAGESFYLQSKNSFK